MTDDEARKQMYELLSDPDIFTELENLIAARIRRINELGIPDSWRPSQDIEHARIALNVIRNYLYKDAAYYMLP